LYFIKILGGSRNLCILYFLCFSYPGASQALPYSSPGHHMPVPISMQGTAPTTQNQPPSPGNKQTSGTY
jgi:hypothetical protein